MLQLLLICMVVYDYVCDETVVYFCHEIDCTVVVKKRSMSTNHQ